MLQLWWEKDIFLKYRNAIVVLHDSIITQPHTVVIQEWAETLSGGLATVGAGGAMWKLDSTHPLLLALVQTLLEDKICTGTTVHNGQCVELRDVGQLV